MSTPTRLPTEAEERAAVIAATALQLATAWNALHRAQLELLRALRRRRSESAVGATQRVRAAVRGFLAATALFDRTARAAVERWAAQDIPRFYRDGAVASLQRATWSVQRAAAPFTWTDRHQGAVTALSAQHYTDLITRISEAVRRAQAFTRDAQAQARTRDGINRKQLLAAHPLDTVVYRDQSRHPVAAWATGALRAQATAATNTGALQYGIWDLEARWFECTDGSECGFQGHADTDHANGTIRSAEDASAWPSSHFGCVRQWTPRPDLNNAPNLTSGDQA